MPVYAPGSTKTVFNGSNGEGTVFGPRGQRSTFLWNTQGKGIPRRADLFTIRALENSHTVSLPMDTVKTQICTTDYGFAPPENVNEGPAHERARDELLEWFDGGFNSNRESIDHWLKQIVGDTLSLDAGITELVPDDRESETPLLAEMYARDGATFVKNPDVHDRLPAPGSGQPAYYQFSMSSFLPPIDESKMLHELADQAGAIGYGGRVTAPIPFTRDDVVWMEESPRSWSAYGFGRVQKVQRLVEVILNQDISNREYFDSNQIPEGVLSVIDSNQNAIERVRQYWKDEVEGKEHKLPIIGGKTEYHPFRASPGELNYLESQKWYNKLVWMLFGVSQSEVGLIEDVNRAAHGEATTAVWRRTTKPLLELIENLINTEILPFHPAYHAVNGEIRFKWRYDNPSVQRLERERQHEELAAGTTSINEIRQERGKDEYPWGDWPSALVNSVARNHPEWFLSEMLDVENPPEPGFGGGGGDPFGMLSARGGDRPPELEGVDSGNPKIAKEPLRNERSGEYPPLTSHVDELSKRVAAQYDAELDDLLDAVADAFPEQREDEMRDDVGRDAPDDAISKGFGIDIEGVVASLGLARTLTRTVMSANLEAMDLTAHFEAAKLEKELADRLDESDVEVSIDFDVEDTFAAEHMQRHAAQKMVTVEQTVKDRIQRTLVDVADSGGNVSDATRALRDTFDELTDSHARLVARTETLSSSRHGSQALGESSDLIGGKEWLASSDSRTRPWHSEMGGTVIGVDEDFVVPSGWEGAPYYQPPDYPRTTHVVGEDQPFNCRCVQRSKLREDLPGEARELAAVDGVTVKIAGKRVEPLTDRMIEAKRAHARDGESFVELLDRALEGGVSAAQRTLDVGSKHTVYKWADRFERELANYNGR